MKKKVKSITYLYNKQYLNHLFEIIHTFYKNQNHTYKTVYELF